MDVNDLPQDKPLVLVIDGMGFIFRSYYALASSGLRNRHGKSTGATLGFLRVLLHLLRELPCHKLFVAYDVSRESLRRRELYPDYKANRSEAPPDLKEQIQDIFDILQAAGIPVLSQEGYEADDIMGSLAQIFAGEHTVGLVSADKDLMQLVRPDVFQILPAKNLTWTVLDTTGVQELKGIAPSQMVDYLAIVGDTSDNIPGVKGIGDKGAVKLLQEWHSLEGIYHALPTLPQSLAAKLETAQAEAFLSQTLATIHTNLTLDLPESADIRLESIATPAFVQALKDLELDSLLRDFRLSPAPQTDHVYPDIWRIQDQQNAANFVRNVQSEHPQALGFHLRVSGKHNACHILEIGLAYLHAEKPQIALFPPEILPILKPLLEDPLLPKVTYQSKFFIQALWCNGVDLQGLEKDVQVLAYLLDASAASYEMDRLCSVFLERPYVAEYEALQCLEVAQAMPDLPHPALWTDMERPCLLTLARMEFRGIRLDAALLSQLEGRLAEQSATLEAQILASAGRPFNLASPSQLAQILFDDLKLPILKKTAKQKQASTDEATLLELAKIHPLPQMILDYRELAKLLSTYVRVLPMLTDTNSRIHTRFQQTVAQTGRLSSIDPNLQNIPVRSSIGREIRHAFVTDPGFLLVSADYSQIELRLLAHLSQDAHFIQAFQSGQDIHRQTASFMHGIPESQVDDNQRRSAKTINYGVSYGMSAFRLSKELQISHAEAKAFIDGYFAAFPRVPAFMQETLDFAAEHGFVQTLYGRRRPTPELLGQKPSLDKLNHAERYAINAVVQGSAADIMKLALVQVAQHLETQAKDAHLLLQIHDELLLECPADSAEHLSLTVSHLMSQVTSLSVPLEVGCGVGASWGSAH